jgi:ATP-dependent RNA helicase DeaD
MLFAWPGPPASMSHKLFSELGLSAELLKAIDKLGFEQASPIQAEAIPALMSGRDVVGQSQTGSGKTAAFGIPAIEKTDPQVRAVQVLILCPTRELAVQVSEEFHKLAVFKRGVRALPIYGGQSYERQFAGLREGVQIVIGTPGRVMDHMRRGTLRLDGLRMAILDEVDVMLNMGFRDDIELILKGTPASRQTVFFSATIPRPIQDLIQRHARDPQQVRIEQKAVTVPTVEQVYYEVDRRFKIELLTRLIDLHDYKLGIIFCNTKRMVDDLVEHLNAQGYSADRLHGDMSQNLRDRVMNRFRKSGLEFLVATDVAARGLDVDDVQVVVNYDLPYDGEDYVHRIGRTGRAGRNGCAITFVSGRELFQIQRIERYTRTRIHRSTVPTPDEVQAARTNVFLGRLRATLQSGEFEKQDEVVGRLLEEGFSSTDIASALIHHLQKEGAPPPREEPPSDRVPRHLGREDPRQRPDRSGAEARERRPVSSEERQRTPARDQRRTEAPPAPPPSPTGRPTAKPWTKQRERPPQAPRTPSQGAREDVHPSTAPARRDARPPVRPAESSSPTSKKGHGAAKDKTRLYMNMGEEMNIAPEDVVNAILGETGLPRQVVGTVDVRERHVFVDVASEHAHAIIGRLNRSDIKGRRLKVKLA